MRHGNSGEGRMNGAVVIVVVSDGTATKERGNLTCGRSAKKVGRNYFVWIRGWSYHELRMEFYLFRDR